MQLQPQAWNLFNSRLSVSTYLYFDYGHAGLIDALPGEQASTDLSSAGAGLDVAVFGHINASLIWSDPLRDGPTTQSGSSRWLFRARSSW